MERREMNYLGLCQLYHYLVTNLRVPIIVLDKVEVGMLPRELHASMQYD